LPLQGVPLIGAANTLAKAGSRITLPFHSRVAQEARMSVNDRADNLASAVRYALETIRFEDGQKLCVRTIISNSLAMFSKP
jgi:hypothetical protein